MFTVYPNEEKYGNPSCISMTLRCRSTSPLAFFFSLKEVCFKVKDFAPVISKFSPF